MEKGIFAYILKFSKRQQIVLTILTILSFPFYYLSLDLPKTIINDAISGTQFPVILDIDIGGSTLHIATFEQVPYLLFLCLAFLGLVLINGGFKFFINIYRGVLGERMLRRMRYMLIDRIMKFPLARFRSTSQGELVAMVNQETEPLGGFIGEAISLPLYQGGLLLTILVFMFVQDWKLGVAAIALYPLQGWLIPKLQRQVNLLNQQRTIRLRKLAENLGEVVAGINEIHINGNRGFFKDYFSKLLGGIFNIRVQIYKKKFFIKFLNNSIAQLTPFLFFLVGGLLVIRGEMSVGALVAALAAYKDLSPPWKELLGWYQSQADARLRYQVLTEQFRIEDHTPAEPLTKQWLEDAPDLPIVASGISLKRHDGIREVDNVSLSANKGEWISLVGTGTSGKNGLAQMFARLVNPTGGRITIAEKNAAHLPETITGRAVGYVGHDSYLFASSIRDNLLLSLKHKPQKIQANDLPNDAVIYFDDWQKEARMSGNSEVDIRADWVDFKSAGANSREDLNHRVESVLKTVELQDDLVRYALARTINPKEHPELTAKIIEARRVFREQIIETGLESVVEFLDPEKYNENASLAENILFGASNHEAFSADGLTEHPVLRQLLDDRGLTTKLDKSATEIATTMVELFSGLPPGHEFFDRYSFIDADDLIQLKRILSIIENDTAIDDLKKDDRKLIRSLPYRVISGRHRIGVFEQSDKDTVLQLRQEFGEKLDEETRSKIDFFAPDKFNALTPIVDNIIFGRIVFGRLGAEDKVNQVILSVLQKLDLMSPILEIGLAAPAGLAGSLLPVPQRQKLVLARALIKQPKVLVINEGLSALDSEETESILTKLKSENPDLSLFWVDHQPRFSSLFNRIAHLQAGKLTKLEEVYENAEEEEKATAEKSKLSIRSAYTVEEDEKIDLLNSIPLFRFLDEPHLLLLARNCDALNIEQGARLFNQGDKGDALYIIIDGMAKILIDDGQTEQQVGECGIHEVIGELALLSNEPRLASVEAITDLALLRLRREVFIDMLQTNGEISYQILQVVVGRFVDSNRKLANLMQS